MNKRPRRVFDRSIVLARCRWECLRRTAEYRADAFGIIREAAASVGWSEEKLASVGWSEEKLARYCLENGGVLEPPAGDRRDHYDVLLARYGVVVLMHPDVPFSEDEMAAFPIFADTPNRQPKVKDRAALRGFARSGIDLSRRIRRRIFVKERVPRGPFQLDIKRLHLKHFDEILAVFDGRVSSKPFAAIARDLGMSLHQAKRAWETARRLIPKWLDLETHIASCATCQAHLRNGRDRLCEGAELQIGLRRSGASRLRPMTAQRLESLAARIQGGLPARRSSRRAIPTRDA